MKRTSGHGAGSVMAIAFATLPLIVMAWVSYESALVSIA